MNNAGVTQNKGNTTPPSIFSMEHVCHEAKEKVVQHLDACLREGGASWKRDGARPRGARPF